MGTGSFNISRLIAELGLKNVPDMAIVERIQPVVNVGDLAGQTPPHVPPSAIFGETAPGAVAQRAFLEIQCLSPGGAFVDWITIDGAPLALMRTAATAVIPAGTIITAFPTSRDTVVSIARIAAAATTGIRGAVLTDVRTPSLSRPIFVRRGDFFVLEAGSDDQNFRFGIGWREVPATESVPS